MEIYVPDMYMQNIKKIEGFYFVLPVDFSSTFDDHLLVFLREVCLKTIF